MPETPTHYTTFFEVCLLLVVLLPLVSAVVSGHISQRYSWAVTFTAPLFLLLSAMGAIYIFSAVASATLCYQGELVCNRGNSRVSGNIFE